MCVVKAHDGSSTESPIIGSPRMSSSMLGVGHICLEASSQIFFSFSPNSTGAVQKTQPLRESGALSEAQHIPAVLLLFLFRLFPSGVAIVTHSPQAPPVLCILFLTTTNLSSTSKHLPTALPLYLMPGRPVYRLPLLWTQSGPTRYI